MSASLSQSSLDIADVLAALGSPDASAGFKPVDEATRGVVIFGCGHLGKWTLDGATGAGLSVLAFADNNEKSWGQRIADVEVMSPQEAVLRYNDDAFFVVAIYNGTAPRKQLAELGCKRIVPYPLFFWQFSAHRSEERRVGK